MRTKLAAAGTVSRIGIVFGSLGVLFLWLDRSSTLRVELLDDLALTTTPHTTVANQRESSSPQQRFVPYDDDDDTTAGAKKVAFQIFQDVSVRDKTAFLKDDAITDDGFIDEQKLYNDDKYADSVDAAEPEQDPENSEQHQLDVIKVNQKHSNQTVNGTDDENSRPPLDQLIDKNGTVTIKGNVQFLLDFAIVGSPHCGSSHLAQWLRQHDHVQMLPGQFKSLQHKKPAELVQALYETLPADKHYKRAYVNTKDIQYTNSVKAIGQHFSRTKLIIGIQHPVRWFERWYNYRVHKQVAMPPAETLVGSKFPDQARFHVHLSTLQKTEHDSRAKQLLHVPYAHWNHKIDVVQESPIANSVFLFETTQLYDDDIDRRAEFRRDLRTFLDLNADLPDAPIMPVPQRYKDAGSINICDETYRQLRHELMEVSMKASVWVQYYLEQSQDVTVTTVHYFHRLMQKWFDDPCEQRQMLY